MLTIVVPGQEFYDEFTSSFQDVEDETLVLEHSLVSLSKWESIWKKPFLGDDTKTKEEILSYIQCMILQGDSSLTLLQRLTAQNSKEIEAYISDKQSATWFNERTRFGNVKARETITSELVYYWMFSYQIPKECETWHLNRLLTLIRIFNVKNAKPKKMSRSEMASRNRELNAKRLSELNTRG